MRWVLVLLCACNQVYGVDETSGPDSDDDGRLDDGDNCPLTANANQRDADGDGFGDACDPCVDGPQLALDGDLDGVDDACDPCLTGSNHDEDGDGALDGCDVCPGQSDDQVDTDRDGVGDVCDPGANMPNTRVAFESFGPARPGWNTGFQEWQNTGDGFGPVPPIENRYAGAYHPAYVLPPVGWHVVAEVALPVGLNLEVGNHLFLEAVTDYGGSAGRRCGVRWAGGWTVESTTTPIALGPVVRIEVGQTDTLFQCRIDGVLVREGAAFLGIPTWLLYLDANLPVEFRWIDIVK